MCTHTILNIEHYPLQSTHKHMPFTYTHTHRVAGTSQTHVETNLINFRGTETSMLLNEPKQSLVLHIHLRTSIENLTMFPQFGPCCYGMVLLVQTTYNLEPIRSLGSVKRPNRSDRSIYVLVKIRSSQTGPLGDETKMFLALYTIEIP